MVKTKNKKILSGLLILSLMALFVVIPTGGQAVSYAAITDTISDSDLGATGVTHTIVATTTIALNANGDYMEFVFDSNFSAISSTTFTCAGLGVESLPAVDTLRCTYSAANQLASGTAQTFTLTGATNPGTAGGYQIDVYSKDSGDVEKEKGTAMVAIIDDVLVTATVDATLTFNIHGLATSTTVNGVDTTGSTTASAIPFGTLDTAASSTMGQLLRVSTNASYGYTVTVEQNQDLTSSNGADIDSFIDGVPATTTSTGWVSPTGTLEFGENGYGHFGITSEDSDLSVAANDFIAGGYRGFDGTNPIEVMYHNGPADGSTADIGSSTVAYTIEISDLQEAGDYQNYLTYICTPTY